MSDLARFMSEDEKRAVTGEFKTAEQGAATSDRRASVGG